MKSLLLIHSKNGSVIIYTLFLTFFAIVAAYLLVTKSETLFLSLENTRDAAKLDKNLEASADLAIKYAASLQKDGGGFNDTIVCPSDFTLTNTSSGTIVFAGTST